MKINAKSQRGKDAKRMVSNLCVSAVQCNSVVQFRFIVFGFFVGLACLTTYNWLFNATTHVGGPPPVNVYNDYYHFHWNFWWIRHALTTPGLNVYETNFVLFPYTNNLAYHTLTPFWYPVWALLEPLTGTLVAMYIIILLATALTGTCAFWFFRQQGILTGLALVGGAIYQLTPAMLLATMLTDINYVSLFWYPLILMIWRHLTGLLSARDFSPSPTRWRGGRGVRSTSLRWAVILALALYGLMMTDYQHLLFLAFLLIPYGLLTLVRMPTWASRIRLIGFSFMALVLTVALLWFVGPLPYILSFDRSTLSPMPIENAQGIPFPLGYFWRYNTFDYRQITLGAILLPALLVTFIAGGLHRFLPLSIAWRGGRGGRITADTQLRVPTWFWLALVIVPLLLSAGPTITLGEMTLSTPYTAFHNLFGGLFRIPARFAPVIILAGWVFIGRTWKLTPTQPLPVHGEGLPDNLTPPPRIQRGGLNILSLCLYGSLFFLTFAESRLTGLMPIQPIVRHYVFYEQIGQETGEPYDSEVILEVPNAGGSGEAWVGDFKNMETQFYGMTHEKRMLNGSLARAPLGNFWYWLYDDPMLAWLGQRRYLEPEVVESQLRERINDWPIGYIVVHQDLIGRDGPTNQEIIGWFNSLDELLCPIWVEQDAVVYRTSWHPDGCPARTPPEIEPGVYQIDIGSQDDERFIGWGWHRQEVVGGSTTWRWMGEYPETKLYVDLPPGDYEIALAAQGFYEPRQLQVWINDVPLGDSVSVGTDGLQTLTFPSVGTHYTVSAETSQHQIITLQYDATITPQDAGQAGDTRKLALAVDWIRFTRRSE